MKYTPLTVYLRSQHRFAVRMTFQRIADVIGSSLPPSAFKYRPWWSNNACNNAATQAWLAAGFMTCDVDMKQQEVTFRPISTGAGLLEPAADRIIDLALEDGMVIAFLDKYCRSRTSNDIPEGDDDYDWFEARTYALSELLENALRNLRPPQH